MASAYTLQRSGARATLTVDKQQCEPAFNGTCTGAWRAVSHQMFEGKAVQDGEAVRFDFSTSGLGWVLHCRPRAVSTARADAVRVRISDSEGTDVGRWQPRPATHVDALSCDLDPWRAQQDTLVFAGLPGLERVWADNGCPEDAAPAARAQCDPAPPGLRMVAPGGAIAPARASD